MRQLRACLTAACAALILGACGGEPPSADASEARRSTFNMSLATMNDSGIQGLVTVSPGGDELTMKMELMGLTGGESYTAALYSGTCESPGEEIMELNPATSGSIGIGSSSTSVPRSELDGSAFHVRASLPDGSMAACGDVPMNKLGS